MELTEEDVRKLTDKMGLIKKVIRLIKTVRYHFFFLFSPVYTMPTCPINILQVKGSDIASMTSSVQSTPTSSLLGECDPETTLFRAEDHSHDTTPSRSHGSFRPSSSRVLPVLASPPLSPRSPISPHSDDSDSVFSSVSTSSKGIRRTFKIPDTWRPSIMSCIRGQTLEEQKRMLVPTIRNEVVRDLVTQMYSYYTKPDKAAVTEVAKKLVQKYPFMRDDGPQVSGYVSENVFISTVRHA